MGAPVLVPLVGQIAAGVPIMAEEHVEELLLLPSAMLPPGGEFFALKVRGDHVRCSAGFRGSGRNRPRAGTAVIEPTRGSRPESEERHGLRHRNVQDSLNPRTSDVNGLAFVQAPRL
jgi:hypothetical protein